MPLRALIDGKEIISSFLSPEEWDTLQYKIKTEKLDVIIAQTRKGGYLRKSKLGLQHFVHNKGQVPEDWKSESIEHLNAKNQILLGCKEAGWEAIPEYVCDGWIADVMAISGNHKIAFEVQWSPQSLETTQERQRKYKKSKVRGCWFFRKLPKEYNYFNKDPFANSELPIFQIGENDNHKMDVKLYGQTFCLQDFVANLLKREYKYCENYSTNRTQEVEIVFTKHRCKICDNLQDTYLVISDWKSVCGNIMKEKELWNRTSKEFHPSIKKCVEDILDSEQGKSFKLGEIKERKYLRKDQHSYMSFGCLICDNIIENFIEFQVDSEKFVASGTVFKVTIAPFINHKIQAKHWCKKTSDGFCE